MEDFIFCMFRVKQNFKNKVLYFKCFLFYLLEFFKILIVFIQFLDDTLNLFENLEYKYYKILDQSMLSH